MNNNYYSDALKEASQSYNNFFEATLKAVLSILDERKLERNRNNIALVFAELRVEDITTAVTDDNIGIFSSVLKRILEYLGVQKNRLFFNNDEKIQGEIEELLVAKIKEYKEKKLEKKLLKEKRISDFKLKLSKLDFDYLKAFVEKIGLCHFSELGLLAKLPKLEEKLEQNDISVFTSDIKIKLSEIEENVWRDQERLSPIKNALESLLLIAEELPRLHQLLEKKGVIQSYSDLVDLLRIKHIEISNVTINPAIENLYNSLKEMTLILLKTAKLKETKEDVATSFIAAVLALRRDNSKAIDMILDVYPNEFLNRLLKELNVIKDDLPQDEIEDLLKRKRDEVEIDVFETELRKGVKTSIAIPSNLDTFSGSDFESFLEKLFRKLGYSVMKTPLTGDQGADLVVEKSSEKIIVQAKRYSGTVSNKAIQEAVAAISYYKCSRAIVVTTSTFTKSALKLAASNKVELWNGRKLNEIINEVNK